MTISQRIASIERQRRLHDNVIPLDAPPERRTTPRWLEWSRANEQNPNAGKSYDRFGGGEAA